MFRLIRVLILILFAFVAGIFFSDANRQTVCTDEGGGWRDRTCFIKE